MARIIRTVSRFIRSRLAPDPAPVADPLALVSCTAWTDRLEVI